MKYKNYIFDFGNVIVRFEPEIMMSPYIPDKEDRRSAGKVIFDRVYWDKLDAGSITDGEVISGIKSRLPARLHKAAVDAYLNWYCNLPFISGMDDLIKEIKEKGGRLFLLSNISTGFAENYSKVDSLRELFSLFDGLVFSGPVKTVKPDLRIFEYLLKKYDISAKESVFIDDNPANINAAAKIPVKGYLFDGDVKKLKSSII